MRVGLAAIVLVCAARAAVAHPLDMGYLRVDRDGDGVAITLDLDVSVAESILRVERLDAPTAAARATELAAATYRSAAPAIDGVACTWGTATAEIKGRSISLRDRASCSRGTALSWELPFVKRLASTFQVLAKVNSRTSSRVSVLEKDRLRIDHADADAPVAGHGRMVWRGVVHSLPLHFPDGLDHVLFAFALVLAGGSLRRLFALVSVAVVAHAAGGLSGIVPGVIELFSPLLVGVIAACAIRPRFETVRWIAVALYAAIHGDGTWRGSEVDLGASLAFDAGAALALIACVLAFAPAAPLLRREPKWLQIAALVVALGSIYFVVVELL